jgi:hypothetical protein
MRDQARLIFLGYFYKPGTCRLPGAGVKAERVPFTSGHARQTYRTNGPEMTKTYKIFDLGDVQAMTASEVTNMTPGFGFCFVVEAHHRPALAVLYGTRSDAEEARKLIGKALEKAVAIAAQV